MFDDLFFKPNQLGGLDEFNSEGQLVGKSHSISSSNQTAFYDANTKLIGTTESSSSGYNHFTNDYSYSGRSESNIFGGYDTFNEKGQLLHQTKSNIFGGHDTFNVRGEKIAQTSSIFKNYK